MEEEVIELLAKAREIVRQKYLAVRKYEEKDYVDYLQDQMHLIGKAKRDFEDKYNEDYDGGDGLDPYPERDFPTAENN